MYSIYLPRLRRLVTDSPHAPAVGVDFVDDHHGGLKVLVQHIDQQLGNARDELLFLLWRYAVTGNFDVHVGHRFLAAWTMGRGVKSQAAAEANVGSSACISLTMDTT